MEASQFTYPHMRILRATHSPRAGGMSAACIGEKFNCVHTETKATRKDYSNRTFCTFFGLRVAGKQGNNPMNLPDITVANI